jgi:hypothetical protein
MMGASSSSTDTVCPGAAIRVLACACSRDRDPQARCTDDSTALQLTQSLIVMQSVYIEQCICQTYKQGCGRAARMYMWTKADAVNRNLFLWRSQRF